MEMIKLIDRRRIRELRKMGFWKKRIQRLEKVRLCVFRSASHMQAQVVDDRTGKVIVSCSSMEKEVRLMSLKGKNLAEKVGHLVAERAVKAGVSTVVFDRNGFKFHGRIRALAESARAAGLVF
jgi:large subunit ribosomal protein L18